MTPFTLRNTPGRLAIIACWLLTLAFVGKVHAQTPYLQCPTPTSIWVSWQTTTGTDSTVYYGTSADSLTNTATAPAANTKTLASNYLWHSVNLTGLTADTFYYYKVQTGATTSAVFRFHTQPAYGTKTGHYRVLVAGDNQIQSPTRWRSLVTAARTKLEALYGVPLEQCVNLMVTDGDQVDNGTISEYQNTHFGMVNVVAPNIPVQTSIGNHEGYTDTSYTLYSGHFRYDNMTYGGITSPKPWLYYAYQVANIVFIHMDSESAETNTTQQNWVQSVVNAANADTNVDFIIPVQHRPYTVELYVGDTSPWIHDTIMPILATSPKCVLNFSGHHHMYARGQTKNYPIYHMIAGGSAWDEYWGQSTEQDMDDVQKTICNWTWQLLDFDLDAKKMTVTSYSEGGPLLGPAYSTSNNTVGFYTSKLVDTFHRQLGVAAPYAPSLTVSAPGTVALPYTFHSTDFSTTAVGETLNTTEFQVATSSTFGTVTKDVVRDVEDFYLDTGVVTANYSFGPGLAKDWIGIYQKGQKPGSGTGTVASTVWGYVNTTGGNTLSTGSLALSKALTTNKEYFAAFFTNDSYTEVAPRVPFYVGNTPILTGSQAAYPSGGTASITYSNAPGVNSSDWIGCYKVGQTPGSPASTVWHYVSTGASGTMTFSFSGLPDGYYFANYFVNGGYTAIGNTVTFAIGSNISTATISKSALSYGEAFSVTYSNGPGNLKDYIGVFLADATPGGSAPGDKLQYYIYPTPLGSANATVNITTPLPSGSYKAALFINDSYSAASNYVTFTISDPRPFVVGPTQLSSNGLHLSWPGQMGVTYIVETSTDLVNWVPVTNLTGAGSSGAPTSTLVYDAPADSSVDRQRFYRVSR